MKHTALTTTIALAAFLAVVPAAFAVDDHHPGGKPAGKAAPAGKAGAMDEKEMAKMQQNMMRMHEQMHKIMQAKDAPERERLTQEHRQMMREHMQTMHGDKGMMDHGKMGTRKMDDTAK